ncbi:MAG TPA: hypothetical protein QF528_01915 [Phycisphaerales bacterium]|jgi:hypothetical protein|nr:hypothetical protein [Phycisphaerales bacterium]|tara:strand:- start:945 stop:1730 length:786 start_codon:yes stop_codon:yes gene_type:complete
MRFLLQSIILTPLLLCSVLFAAPDTTKYAHAKILGKLLYTDLSLSCDEQPVSQVLHQFQDDLNIDMFVFWKSKDKDGIDKSTPITLKLTNQPAIVVLERIIEKLNNTAPTAWQLRDSMLEIGFKERFTEGSAMELRTYDVMNLMFTIRDFDNAPTMGTTGGGGVNFGDPTDDPNRLTKNEEAEQLINTITDFVESEQWKVHGGNCTIRFYKGSLLVKAPDFVHRQLGGYPFAPLKPKNMKTRTIKFSGGAASVRLPRVPNI